MSAPIRRTRVRRETLRDLVHWLALTVAAGSVVHTVTVRAGRGGRVILEAKGRRRKRKTRRRERPALPGETEVERLRRLNRERVAAHRARRREVA